VSLGLPPAGPWRRVILARVSSRKTRAAATHAAA